MMSDDDEDADDEDERPGRKKQRTGGGGGKKCVCGPNGCKRKVNFEGHRLPRNMKKRLSWLHCWYPPTEVPAEFLQEKAPDRRVHPCHFRPEAIELIDRTGGSGACSRCALARILGSSLSVFVC